MPTYETTAEFDRNFADLTPEEKRRFRVAVGKLVEDLKAGREPRQGLRVKGYKLRPGVLEMTWAPDGRAFFTWGTPVQEGERHVIWLALGGHEIF